MPTKNIGLRIDADLLAQVDALAAEQGTSRTFVIVEALHRRLGLAKSSAVEQRLADVEQRLTIVEQSLGDVAEQRPTAPNKPSPPSPSVPTAAAPTPPPKHPSQNRREGASKPAQVSGHPTESPQKADGGRWLTTSQAVEVSQARGGTGNSSTLKRRGRRCETEVIGLRWIDRPPSKDNSLASFEDLRWGQ